MSRLSYYALPNRLTKAVNINLTFRNILPYILFIFLIIIPIIEIYITEMNQNELNCISPMNINIVDWSITKNILTMMLTFIMFVYLLCSKHNISRYLLRIVIFVSIFFILIWLIVGFVLIYRDCSKLISDDMMRFNFFNLLLGIISIAISLCVVYDSFNRSEIPLLDQ